MRRLACRAAVVVALGLTASPVFAQHGVAEVMAWPECGQYFSSSPCRVVVNLSDQDERGHRSRVVGDVTLRPGQDAALLLIHGSPLIACTVGATATALTRDVAGSFGGLLSTIGGFGAFNAFAPVAPPPPLAEALGAYADMPGTHDLARVPHPAPASPQGEAMALIHAQLKRLETDLTSADTASVFDDAEQSAKDAARALADNWLASYSDDNAFSTASGKMMNALQTFLTMPLPTVAPVEVEMAALQDALREFHRRFDRLAESDTAVREFLAVVAKQLTEDTGVLKLLQDRAANVAAARPATKQALETLQNAQALHEAAQNGQAPYTTAALPLTRYVDRQVAESVSCKDVISQNAVIDPVTFTAYYEAPSPIEVSTGFLMSFLGARQVGIVAASEQSNVLGVTSQSSRQFMPAVFVEYHPWNYDCGHWACSFGVSGGISLNPNNGSTAAEFFEGISFGIQRFAILVGLHNGGYQDFADGFSQNQSWASGTAPPIVKQWRTRGAVGVAYRIPLR